VRNGRPKAGIRGNPYAKPILEPNLLDRQIQAQEFQLRQSGTSCASTSSSVFEQIAEPRNHGLGPASLLLDQHHDGAERVEGSAAAAAS
jgi:hypothetical protein